MIKVYFKVDFSLGEEENVVGTFGQLLSIFKFHSPSGRSLVPLVTIMKAVKD